MSLIIIYLFIASNIIFNYIRIDQLTQEDDVGRSYRQLTMVKKISEENYVKALMKCNNILSEFSNESEKQGKTSLIKDINDLKAGHKSMPKVKKEIVEFAISQKKLINYHKKMFINRLIKEVNRDIWTKYKSNYI